MNAVITGIASYLPDYILNNEELSRIVDTTDEWITTRVGIKERRIQKGIGEENATSTLGYNAVKRLLEKTNTSPEEVELLICATSTADYRFPSAAAMISHRCGMKHAYAYDIQAACSGFLFALQAANAYIKSGLYKKIIVVAAEKMSSITNYTDRATCPLFGDGAGAALIEPTTDNEIGLIDCALYTDGSGKDLLLMKSGGSACPATYESVDNHQDTVYQEGRSVYKHAVMEMYKASLEIMKRNGLTADTIDWYLPHQANLRIIEAVGDRLGIDHEKVIVNIQKYGNTSAATLPIGLDEWESRFKKGDKIVLAAFGAGFTWGAAYIKWGY